MSPYIDDPDFQLHVGDALEMLQAMPAESVHCCVTSPPYWGLRDYGTGTWEGGDAECDHKAPPTGGPNPERYTPGGGEMFRAANDKSYLTTCGKCGARRVDQQLGLEPTPDEYVTNMVNVFREVRRVLRADGTLWLNIGDSYNAYNGGAGPGSKLSKIQTEARPRLESGFGLRHKGLKPKDLCGIPWRLAFALQADGWYLRSDIIWSKPNPMPESVTDRPAKAHEYLFLLTKSPRYFYDADAIREPAEWARWGDQTNGKHEGSESGAGWIGSKSKEQLQGGRQARRYSAEEFKTTDERNTRFQGPNPTDGGRNKRSVWEIATAPYPDAHFATFPQALVEPCVKAGTSEYGCCPECGAPWEREVERGELVGKDRGGNYNGRDVDRMVKVNPGTPGLAYENKTTGWKPSCECFGDKDMGSDQWTSRPHEPVPCVVLDPFLGSGTTAQVARRLGRRSIGIELNPEYAEFAARRLQQQSLFA